MIPPSSDRIEGRVLAWMCAIIAVNQLGFGALIPVLPLYAQSFGVTASAIGATVAVYGLARLLSALPCGRLADRLGRRPTLALGGLVSALGNLWCAFAHGYGEFLAARFVSGVGAGIVLVVGSVILADISRPERRGRMMATYQGSFLFAVGIGPFPGGWMAEHWGLAAPFAGYALAAFAVGGVAWFAVPETREYVNGEYVGGKRSALAATSSTDASPTACAAPPASPGREPFSAQLRALLSSRGFLLVSLLGFAHAVVRTGALFAIVPVIAAAELGLGAGEIGTGFALGSVLGLAASYPAGAISDRWGRKPVIVPASLLTALSLLAFCVASSFTGFLIGCLIWGIASAVSGAGPTAYAADTTPPGMSAAGMSTYRMLADVGYVLGPITLGLVADMASPPSAVIAGALLIGGVTLAFARWAPETLPAAARTTPQPR